MMELLHYRGLRQHYNVAAHGDGIYFATDTQEIIHNGVAYSGAFPEELIEKINQAERDLIILKGEGEGSVKNQIDLAINEFATKISDNGTIDTFKELIDYAANNSSNIGDLIVTVDQIKEKDQEQDERLDKAEEDIKTNSDAITNMETTIDTKIESALSWEDVL